MAHGYNVLSIQRTNQRSPQVYIVTRFDCSVLVFFSVFLIQTLRDRFTSGGFPPKLDGRLESDVGSTQAMRQKILREYCHKLESNNAIHIKTTRSSKLNLPYRNILVDDKHKLIYCYVPKAGCSGWKARLIALANNNSRFDALGTRRLWVHVVKNLQR